MAFERDLGYLKPFLQKLAAAAEAMPPGAGRDRLAQLAREEFARWEEIEKLLAGVAEPGAAEPRAYTRALQAWTGAPARPGPGPGGLTVGSLRRA